MSGHVGSAIQQLPGTLIKGNSGCQWGYVPSAEGQGGGGGIDALPEVD
jgi:hypothetical protein